jgi:hypothetical protein
MSVGLASQVGSLPSTQRFLRSVEQDLRSGRSVWVLFPQGGEALRLWDLLLHNLEGPGGMIVAPVDLGTVGSYGPFDVLRSVVEDWEDTGIARFLEDLTLCHQAPEVLLLKSLEEIPPPKRNEWLLAVERWAASSLRHSPERRRKLCVVAAAYSVFQNGLPKSDVALSVRMWWGVPSALEIHLACRLMSQEETPLSLWREHLIPSLAGNDLTLGEYLWDVVTDPPEALLEKLAQYGAERGWKKQNAEEVCERWKPMPPGKQTEPSEQMIPFWAQGWIVYTPEYGGEVHSALLALLGNEPEIAHRLWRAQAALLLPAVDSARLRVCEQLTQFYGETWTCWGDGWEQSLYPELGAIEHAIRKGPIGEPEKQRWLKVVHPLRDIRNKVAHYQPILFNEFVEFWECSALLV